MVSACALGGFVSPHLACKATHGRRSLVLNEEKARKTPKQPLNDGFYMQISGAGHFHRQAASVVQIWRV